MNSSFREFLESGGAFQGYAYAYPHKLAYRPFTPAIPLETAWKPEDKSALFLYAHVPFCEMRCGFCNLFTTANPESSLVTRYLDVLERQAEVVAAALGFEARFSRFAIGGGTPTFLTSRELERLFSLLAYRFGRLAGIPTTIETSPATVDAEKVAFFKEAGVTRVSVGVQSFLENEVRSLGRAQRVQDVREALRLLAEAGFACLNVDLIYGVAGQTAATWLCSIEEALLFAPQEIYLYPLYVRPMTGLDRLHSVPSDHRGQLYCAGRDLLLERGYRQISMRLFRAVSYAPSEGPVYCCQEDGMVGIGVGARSYTTALHYSTEYAVGRAGVAKIISDFVQQPSETFGLTDYGCWLDKDEQRRRYLLKSILRVDGLDLADYRARFGTEVFEDLPELFELVEQGLALRSEGALRLNASGLELSDAIGPWLCSAQMRARIDACALA